jgi:hypothetical protein
MKSAFTIGLILLPAMAAAQDASLKGKVLTDSTERPISGVVVSIDQLKLETLTDSAGDFILRGIKPGAYVVTAKKIGFGALATRVRFTAREVVEADFLMTPGARPLPEARVEAKPKPPANLVEFEERRAQGAGGRFLTQSDFEKRAWSLTSDVLRQVPSLEVIRDQSRPSQAYVAAGRLQFNSSSSVNDASPAACFAAVVLDGIFVYQGNVGERPFDINSLPPNTIAGFEYYVSSASIPAKYNGNFRGSCGLVIIWTKI